MASACLSAGRAANICIISLSSALSSEGALFLFGSLEYPSMKASETLKYSHNILKFFDAGVFKPFFHSEIKPEEMPVSFES